ncbi:RagB/SusD family nutrient uptake outer membrane protein [Chitinophaga parva]|nr:RagB/SusD family nutrient uptake outer membrane protein [Chitinophaga parva]
MRILYTLVFGGLMIGVTGCNKYLDAKPSNFFEVPVTLDDCQSLMDDEQTMNTGFSADGEASADNFYLDETEISIFSGYPFLSLYLWQPDVYASKPTQNVWGNLYKAVLQSNVVLETLNNVRRDNANSVTFDNVKGSALFFRGYVFLKLLSMYSKGYNEATKEQDLGIPLRLSSDFNSVSVRSSVSESYKQVVSDLTVAASLLSEGKPSVFERPSRRAAFGALAEVYLVMHQYEKAELYADSCLKIGSKLIDYNQFDTTSDVPFPSYNDEVIINLLSDVQGFYTGYYDVDTSLLKSYDVTDLRKQLFFQRTSDSTFSFKGSYYASGYFFSGIAVDEIYLIRAECRIRLGKVQDGIDDLNTLLVKRYIEGTFTPYKATDASTSLSLVLQERRKELVFRDLRWSDIKRLNLDGENIGISRMVNNQPLVLKPNENRFAIAIPAREITISGMQQNPR